MSELIIGGRQSGKTTRAVEWVKAGSNRVLAVMNEQEKDRIVKQFGLTYQQVETWDTIMRTAYRPAMRQKKIAIDNAEMLLERIFYDTAGIGIITITDSNGKEK